MDQHDEHPKPLGDSEPADGEPADGGIHEPTPRLRATAYHEAGHAVMALELGRPVHKVTIVPGQSDLGMRRDGVCHIQKGRSKASKDWLEDEVLILFAGMVAEARWTGSYCLEGAAQDLRQIRRYAMMRADGVKQIERLERRWLSKTENYLSDAALWAATERIATALVQEQTISGRAARHWFDEAQRQTR